MTQQRESDVGTARRPRTEDPVDEPLALGTPRPALTSISMRRVGGTVTADVRLTLGGRLLTGSATTPNSDRERAIASATLDALRDLLPESVQIESAQVVTIPGRRVALTVVEFPDASRAEQLLVGSSLVRGEVEDALARSVLSALNRRLNNRESS